MKDFTYRLNCVRVGTKSNQTWCSELIEFTSMMKVRTGAGKRERLGIALINMMETNA